MASLTKSSPASLPPAEEGAVRSFHYADNVYFQDGHLLTAVLALLLYLILATSLDAAGYVSSLGFLVPVTLGAFAMGLLMSFSRFDGFFALSHSLFTGLAWILFLMTRLVTAEEITPFVNNGIPKLQAEAYFILLQWLNWVDAAFNGGASNNNYVFIFEIAFLTWWLTFLGVWAIFRYGYTWRAVIPAGLVLVLNVYYASFGKPSLLGFLVVFSLLALLLLVRTNLAEQQLRWRERRIHFSPDITFDFMRNALIYSVIVLSIAWIVPGLQRNAVVREVLTPANTAWQGVAQWWREQYPNLNTQPVPGVAVFGNTLTLGGARQVGDGSVFAVQASAPVRYWRAVTFDTYTDGQWLNTSETQVDFAAEALLPAPSWGLRTPLTQTITLLAPLGGVVFGAPDIGWSDLPFTAYVRPVTETASFDPEGGPAVELSYAYSRRPLDFNDSYTIVSSFSAVTESSLSGAGTDYPAAVLEQYLQLPESFSPRVAELARTVTASQETPYDQAKAIERFLRTYTYNEEIAAPPAGVDPVEYFLFDLKQGYCDYYATAMTLMLRSLGIPARTASGYAEGSYDEEADEYAVSERDAHTWVEVYFPGYGWIEFEPTAGESQLDRPEGGELTLDQEPSGPAGEIEQELQTGPNELNSGQNLPLDEQILPEGGMSAGSRWAWWLSIALVAVAILLGGLAIWRSRFGGPTRFSAEMAPLLYERMHVWAERLGLRVGSHQTPYEGSRQLVEVLPDGKPYIEEITDEYVHYRFARHDAAHPSGERRAPAPLMHTWKALQPLFVRAWLRKRLAPRRR